MARSERRTYLPGVVRVTAPARRPGEFAAFDETPTWRIVARRAIDKVGLMAAGADTLVPVTEPLDVGVIVPSWTHRIDVRVMGVFGWGTVPSATHPALIVAADRANPARGVYSESHPFVTFGVE